MKLEICAFSGYKIYPSRGVLFVRGDNRSFRILNGKCEAHFLKKKNPRKFSWTVFFRRLHKKGTTEAIAKRRTRRVIKSSRGVVGAPFEVIAARRNQPLEERQAVREEALNAAKTKKKEERDKKKQDKIKNLATKASNANLQSRIKTSKSVKTSKPLARSR